MSARIGDAGYRIIAPLASGGMGEVFKAEHIITRRVEAIKRLRGAGAAGESERFLREIQLQASLSHPNIAAVYNAFQLDDDLVMVMELVDGEPLRALLDRGRLPLTTALDYACQALRAIACAHAAGIVHRDISPANIIVTPQGVVKLTDFGLAKAAASPSVSEAGASMGSPYYMSPEQVKDATQASPRSDIYSLGAVLYEMATGKKPFEGESSFLVMQAQVERAPAPPIELEPALPPALNDAILQALAKDPARRFATAEAFRLTLEREERPGTRTPPAAEAGLSSMPAAGRQERETIAAGSASAGRHPGEIGGGPPGVDRSIDAARTSACATAPGARLRRRPYLWISAGICAAILPVGVAVRRPQADPQLRLPPPATPKPPLNIPAPVLPPADKTEPAVAAAPVPLARHRTKISQAPRRELMPVIMGQPAPAPRAEAAVAAPPEVPVAAAAPALPDRPRATAASAEDSGVKTAAATRAPAPAPPPEQKKPRHRLWRALGKVLGPFH